MLVFFSVGEPSGDQHAAHLIGELRSRLPNLRVAGFGGPMMERAGCQNLFQLTTMAVMGIFQVLPLIFKFYGLVKMADDYFQRNKPDLVVLVDFPGFNWWIARKAKKAGIPVVYYLPPQLWAWAPWRIQRVRKNVNLVLSGLTFETDWYAERGIPVLYVGHPFFDEVAEHQLDESFCREWTSDSSRTVALLPGSRGQEVTRSWPLLLDAARQLHARHPNVNFLVANYKESQRQFCVDQYEKLQENLPLSFFVGKTSEIIELADCAMMVSGSVSLEMLARRTPAVVLYRTIWPTYFIGKLLVTCKYMSLPNLIAGRKVMPEFLSVGSPNPVTDALVSQVDRWLSDDQTLAAARQELEQIRDRIYVTGATKRTAEVIIQRLLQATPKGDSIAA
ncbi:MAG: lipid-A-disaccharide synthase [Planctomycetes bacterium]|nr:lipid-A-disaccharide synthase [Planctomycetota bacterium]